MLIYVFDIYKDGNFVPGYDEQQSRIQSHPSSDQNLLIHDFEKSSHFLFCLNYHLFKSYWTNIELIQCLQTLVTFYWFMIILICLGVYLQIGVLLINILSVLSYTSENLTWKTVKIKSFWNSWKILEVLFPIIEVTILFDINGVIWIRIWNYMRMILKSFL